MTEGDARLETAAALFPEAETGADIGANHGLLACRLLTSDRVRRMWVTDLSADALRQARENISARGLADRARFSVGDGFAALLETVDAAAILGMGGQTIEAILRSAPRERLPGCLIVSAHTEQERARRAMYETGYRITDERLVLSGGRFYVLERAERGSGSAPDERALFLGPCLVRQTGDLYRRYLERRIAAYRPSRSAEGQRRFQWLTEEAQRVAADGSECV